MSSPVSVTLATNQILYAYQMQARIFACYLTHPIPNTPRKIRRMTGQEVTLVAALLSALGTLSGVVLHLWKKLTAVTEDLEKKLEHCESQHDVANKQILDLSVQLAEIRGTATTITELKSALLAIIKGQNNGQHQGSS